MFLLLHPLLNMPAPSPTPRAPHPLRWHGSLPPCAHPSACLSSAAAWRKFIAGPDCYGQILIKCCFAAICLIGHRRDVLSMCRLCLRLPARLADAPSPLCLVPLAVTTTKHGMVERRGRGKLEGRGKEAVGLQRAGLSPPSSVLTVLS